VPVAINVLANDSDPDADPLTITAVGAAGNGLAEITGSAVTYTPTPSFVGTDVFTYTISDGALTATARVTVTVNAVNEAPIAVDDMAETDEETAVVIDVLANDGDPDADPLAIVAVGAAGNGTAVIDNGVVVYTPTVGFVGTDVFTYTISDGSLTASARVTVTVHQVDWSLFLPVVINRAVFAPDLVVSELAVTADDVTIRIENVGNTAVTSEFWVDLYVNPAPPPTAVNQTWQMLAEEGVVWGVVDVSGLTPGGSMTLNLAHPALYEEYTDFAGSFRSGDLIYVQVDSANRDVGTGSVYERHEMMGEAYNNIVQGVVP
jgi:hypothetical protein